MALVRSELRDEVAFRIADSSSTYSSRINRRLQFAVNTIATDPGFRLHDLMDSYTYTLVTGQNTLDVTVLTNPIGISTVKNITQFRRILPMTANQEASVDETTTGEPSHYYHFNNSSTGIRLYPTVDAAYNANQLRVRYRRLPAVMTNDSSLHGLLANSTANSTPDYLDELVILGAAWRMMRDLNETETAAALMGEYKSVRSRILDLYAEEFAIQGGTVAPVLGR